MALMDVQPGDLSNDIAIDGHVEHGDDDLRWTNPMMVPEFRQRYLAVVYGCLAVQYLIVAIVTNICCNKESLKSELQDTKVVCIIFIVLCVISYLLLYVRSLNHPEKNRVTELMQALFTLFFVLMCALLGATYNYESIIYAAYIICATCVIESLIYLSCSARLYTKPGVQMVLYIQCLLTGIVMCCYSSWHPGHRTQFSISKRIRYMLEGYTISILFTMYFAYGTARMVSARLIRFNMQNIIFGVTITYTTPIINYYYSRLDHK